MHSENRNPCVFPGQIGGVNRSLDMHGLRNRGACVIKSWLSHAFACMYLTSNSHWRSFVLRKKHAEARGKLDYDV